MPTTGLIAFGPSGPLLTVRVGPSAASASHARRLGQVPVAAQPFVFLLDTGASVCVVDPGVVQALSLPLRSGPQATRVAAGLMLQVSQYDASLSVPDPAGSADLRVANLIVSEMALGSSHYHGLIGRPLLQLAELLYDGRRAEFRLSW